jgi:hypothetical protein
MRAEVCRLLKDGIEFVDGCLQCGLGRNRSDQYKILQSIYEPLAMLKVPISKIIDSMKAVQCEDPTTKWHTSKSSSYYHKAPTRSQTLAGKLETIEKRVGICLDCVRASKLETLCRFQHE